MGQSKSFAELNTKLQRLGTAVGQIPEKATGASCLQAKTILLASLRAAAPSGRLRGVGRAGAKLGVIYDVKRFGSDQHAVGQVRATGPWQLIERNTKPHAIVPRGARGLGRSRRARQQSLLGALGDGVASGPIRTGGGVLRMPGAARGFAAYARHPGTTGKHPWGRALPAVIEATPKAFQLALHREITKVF